MRSSALGARRRVSHAGRWRLPDRRRLERGLAQLTIVQPDDKTISVCAEFRLECQRAGHALRDKVHDGDRWIAATAIRLDLPLVTHDRVFTAAPGLTILTVDSTA